MSDAQEQQHEAQQDENAQIPPKEFRKLKLALVDQLPRSVATSWWRRVRQAANAGSEDALQLLKAEAKARLDHERRRQQQAVLDVLFDALKSLVATVAGKQRD